MTYDLEIDASRVWISPNHKLWRFTRKVLQARRMDDRIFVIFDYVDYEKGKPAQNLVAYDLDQNELWSAENATELPTDAFVNFCPGDSLRISNFAGYICTIDPETGLVLDSTLPK